MSDANANSEKSGKSASEAEVLGPEKTAQSPRPRKEPPVIDGEAEEVGSASGGNSDGDGAAPAGVALGGASRGSLLRIAGIAALFLAIGAGVAFFVIGRQVGPTEAEEAIAGLDGRLVALEKKSAQNTGLIESEAQRLDARLGEAEKRIAAEAQTPDSVSAVTARLDKLTEETQALGQSLGEARAAGEESRQAIEALRRDMPPAGVADQVARLDAMLKALNAALDGLAPKVDEMEARLATLEAKKEDPDAAARAALGLALANLARAAETKSPFKSELDAVASFLPNEPELTSLDAAAATGVATRASLKERFPALVPSVFEAERRARGDGLWARFLAHARSLVTVRRTGEIAGEDTEAVIARMEERLKADDLAGAVAEGKALKGAAAEAAAPWLEEARARVETETLLRTLSARVAERLSKAKG